MLTASITGWRFKLLISSDSDILNYPKLTITLDTSALEDTCPITFVPTVLTAEVDNYYKLSDD